MQKIRLIAVGALKERYLTDAVMEYSKRLSRFCDFKIIELPEKRTLDQEGEDILRNTKGVLATFDVHGKQMTSDAFARALLHYKDNGDDITFVIGSSEGISHTVKSKAKLSISLSCMTFPHQLARIICCEQIYRAFMINTGSKYHK